MSRACGYRLPNMTTTEPSISISRDVDAPIDKVFDYLARPANHTFIDGSGMLRGTTDDRVLSGVGETFEMEMHNDRLGDYVVENRVVEYEPSRRIAWMPVLKSVAQPDPEVQLGVPAHNVWGVRAQPPAWWRNEGDGVLRLLGVARVVARGHQRRRKLAGDHRGHPGKPGTGIRRLDRITPYLPIADPAVRSVRLSGFGDGPVAG
jgi:hypothetical protein